MFVSDLNSQTKLLKMAKFFDIFIFLALFEISNGYKPNRKSYYDEPRSNYIPSDRFGNRSREKAAKHYLRKQREMRMRSERSRANALRQDIRYLIRRTGTVVRGHECPCPLISGTFQNKLHAYAA